MPENQQIIEPLAKFHARVDLEGRFVIPKYIRDIFGIKPGDYLQLKIRKVIIDKENKIIYVDSEKQIIEPLQRRGGCRIPHKLRKELELSPGDLIEIILLDFYEPTKANLETHFKYVFRKSR